MAGYVPAHQKAKWSWKIVDAVKSMAPILVHEAASMPNATLTSQVLAIDPDGGDYAEEGEYEKYEKENVKKEKLDTMQKLEAQKQLRAFYLSKILPPTPEASPSS